MACRRHRCLLLTFFVALLAAGVIASASLAGAAQVGVNVTTTLGFDSPKAMAAIRASDPAWVRVFVSWSQMEPQQNVYDARWIAEYNRFFHSLKKGTKIDVDIYGTPTWASGGSTSAAAPPIDDTTYGDFAAHMVAAFHDRVTAWELWNEESSTGWWTGSIAQYADLVKAAYPAIKAADPKAIVILGANSPTWLATLYADGIKNYFDADAIHTDTACNVTSPYIYEYNRDTTTVNQYFFLGFTGTHALMAAHGDGSKPIYMTELGWSSTTAECSIGLWAGQKAAGVSEQTQATYLTQAYHCLAQPQYSYVKAAMWFDLYDLGADTAPLDNYGLLNADYSPKPAYNAFQQVSLHGDGGGGACGNFAPPKIRILRPTPGKTYNGPLKIAVAATSRANGVREITIYLNKHVREHFWAHKGFPPTLRASLTWLGAKRLRPGPHRIKITSIDKLGNTATKFLLVVRAPRAATRGAHHTHH